MIVMPLAMATFIIYSLIYHRDKDDGNIGAQLSLRHEYDLNFAKRRRGHFTKL